MLEEVYWDSFTKRRSSAKRQHCDTWHYEPEVRYWLLILFPLSPDMSRLCSNWTPCTSDHTSEQGLGISSKQYSRSMVCKGISHVACKIWCIIFVLGFLDSSVMKMSFILNYWFVFRAQRAWQTQLQYIISLHLRFRDTVLVVSKWAIRQKRPRAMIYCLKKHSSKFLHADILHTKLHIC